MLNFELDSGRAGGGGWVDGGNHPRWHLYMGGNFAHKCISTTPIGVAMSPALPLDFEQQNAFIINLKTF